MKKKISLGFFPTPLHELKKLSNLFPDYRIFIKRDDNNGLATGGNKVRKLEYLLQDALDKGCDSVITAGALQSNHCRITAAACARIGIECHLLLGGEKPRSYNGNLLLSHLVGGKIHFSKENRKGEGMHLVEKELKEKGFHPYIIPYGGSNWIGALGYTNAVEEIKNQLAEIEMPIHYIVFASSSGGTHAGLLAGEDIYKLGCQYIGINIDKDETNGQLLEDKIIELYSSVIGQHQLPDFKMQPEIQLKREYDKGGYGVVTEQETETIMLLAKAEGILLDPVYTARAFNGMLDMMRKKMFEPGSNILFIHTGGLPAIFHYCNTLKYLDTKVK
ncbi:D-cysteine desulfhydrase family protein [Mariniphaga sediminis]|uniref:D-cysteine desulfhydrase family protein n=1 Tax=Mariniphaga sediminis TaxID=1628158 RepID=A0A399CW44_9BACT|nr:D-cysteine desulfhydrase family protein [Mariniphaga sediminis]RIH63924.1 D-cysteine desulfhydrase family protein [Mariniphaga sediminis]